jgi:hypothetical protein
MPILSWSPRGSSPDVIERILLKQQRPFSDNWFISERHCTGTVQNKSFEKEEPRQWRRLLEKPSLFVCSYQGKKFLKMDMFICKTKMDLLCKTFFGHILLPEVED